MGESKRICVDFDDTLCMRDETVAPHAREVLKLLKDSGHEIYVLSSRFNPKIWGDLVEKRMEKVSDWLQANGLAYDKVVAYKPAADIYIDDKALRFEGDWNQTLEEMKKILRLS
ncbi:MAG: hypothetical protein O7H41_01535 [Planctomycetota bacterium]|nr:hypothetical protein [Planctomycetota bacterium]